LATVWRIPDYFGVFWPDTDVKWPFSAVEIEPVKPGVLDHPLGDHEGADTRHPEIHGKTESRAVRPAIAIELTSGVLVQVPYSPGVSLQVYQLVQSCRGEGIGKLDRSESIDDRIEYPQA